jgi:hypothetical protein
VKKLTENVTLSLPILIRRIKHDLIITLLTRWVVNNKMNLLSLIKSSLEDVNGNTTLSDYSLIRLKRFISRNTKVYEMNFVISIYI